MIQLLRFFKPSRMVVVLAFAHLLYLPPLTADIVRNGRVKGDTGGMMSLVAIG